jgi:hypothetical protein
MPKDLDYESTHFAYDFQCPKETGGGIQCKNYKVCASVLPPWWWECNESYLCTNCEMLFGEFKFKEPMECPICFDVKHGLSQLKCDHFICVDCFKRCYYGDEDRENEPKFPYPELEEEYFHDMDNVKWNEYPLIYIFHNEWNMWDDKRMEKYDNEESLRHCPLCRK